MPDKKDKVVEKGKAKPSAAKGSLGYKSTTSPQSPHQIQKVEKTQQTQESRTAEKKTDKKRVPRELDDRKEYTESFSILFGADLPDVDEESAALIKKSRKMDNVFGVGGILQNSTNRTKHDYLLLEKLGPTEFKVSETSTGDNSFLKMEASKMPWHGPKLKWSVDILRNSQKLDPAFRTHFLDLVDSGLVPGKYNFMVTKLAGVNLLDLRLSGSAVGSANPEQQFSVETAFRLCLQTLQAIHDVHLCRFVHRNIHPKNFLVGLGSKSRVVYIVGFSLAEQYYPKIKPQTYDSSWSEYFGRLTKFPWIDQTFQSRAFHRGDKIYRQHDMESWLYMCYFLFNSNCLPWKCRDQSVKRERAVYNYKNIFFAGAFDETLSKYVPLFLKAVREMVYRECSPKPIDYSAYGEVFLAMQGTLNCPIDWNGPFRFKAPMKRQPSSDGSPKPLADLQVVRPAIAVKPYQTVGGVQSSHSHRQNVVSCETCPKPPGFELLESPALPLGEDNAKPQVNSANAGQRMEHTEEEENTDSTSSASEKSKENKTMNHENFLSAQKSTFGGNQSSSADGRKDSGGKQLPSSKK